MRWFIKLSQYKICYLPRIAIKRQVIANFIVELMSNKKLKQLHEPMVEVEGPLQPPQSTIVPWTLHLDRLSNDNGYVVGLVFSFPTSECLKIEYPLRLGFKAFNDEANYEAFLVGLRLV